MNPQHKRLRYWEAFDEVRIRCVPRYKTSGLSGDEWRNGAVIELLHKGGVVAERFYTSMQAAIMYLPTFIDESITPIPEPVLDLELKYCDQPSCRNRAVNRYKIKKLYSDRGEELAPHDYPWPYFYRQFCAVHSVRGDCGLEDSDANYEVVYGPGPDPGANVQESPSVLGAVIGEDDLVHPEDR